MRIPRTMRVLRSGALPMALALLLCSCAMRSQAPPGPGWERGAVPDLRGRTVLLLPFQAGGSRASDLDRELAFALRARSEEVSWTDAATLEGIGSGTLSGDPRGLDVSAFLRGEVERVGDPLFGDLYRLAAFADADLALLPVRGTVQPAGEATEAAVAELALLVPRTGRVLWQGIVEGPAGPSGSPAVTAALAERLARRLVP